MKSAEVNIFSPLRRRRSTSTTERRHKSESRSLLLYMKYESPEDACSQPCLNHGRIFTEYFDVIWTYYQCDQNLLKVSVLMEA